MNVLVSTICTPDDRKTLAVVRSLGTGGARVRVAADRLAGQAVWSRFVAGRDRVPDPGADEAAHVAGILEAVERERIDVVLPTQSETTHPLARSREVVARSVGLVVPTIESLEVADSKWATMAAARDVGIAVPRTFRPRDLDELAVVAERIRYPVVVKPDRGYGAFGVWFAADRARLIEGWSTASAGIGPGVEPDLLVQEAIPGLVHDACFLFRHGEPRAGLTQVRRLMYPGSGGGGILNETTEDRELIEAGSRLLRHLRWHGPAQVEFKRDARTGRPVLMEVNGRLWGTVDLAIQAGVDFPALICRMALDGDVGPVDRYRVGLRYRWPLPYALLHALETARPLRAAATFLGPRHATRSDLRITDPLPQLAEIAFAARRMWRRGSLRPGRSTTG